jgi:hypothetical protein
MNKFSLVINVCEVWGNYWVATVDWHGNLNLIWGIICGRLFFSFDFLFFVEITSVGRFGGYEKNL